MFESHDYSNKGENHVITKSTACNILVKGLVQGIGFRPFVYRMATNWNLAGWVKNTNSGVEIYIEGENKNIEEFIKALKYSHPPAAIIEDIFLSDAVITGNYKEFRIKDSEQISNNISIVSPDIAVCSECLRDIKNQTHRIDYPLTNCTNCGPRFSIIKQLPYDRRFTTMHNFEMCPTCQQEYSSITDRRFHAQPVACNHCGPKYSLHTKDKSIENILEILKTTARIIDDGGVVTLKGIGGFNLACNALNNKAAVKLRTIKKREEKPFAVMFRNNLAVKRYAKVSVAEETLLTDWKNPIVLLELQANKACIAPAVCNGFSRVGAFLPYTPFHYQLFELLNTDAIVLTSANISDEPILINNSTVKQIFLDTTDAVIDNNRDIHNRNDDSVCQLIKDTPQVIRRSRGYVPLPVNVNLNCEGIFAAGAELTNCFCIGKENYAIISQHIGDLKNFETYEFYKESIERFRQLFKFTPTLVVHDLHPDYLSSKFALDLGLESLGVQHHHAHIAAVMAEHRLDEKVIGVSLDGTGYGTDGKIWGGEILVCNLKNFERINHFKYIPMPGGEVAVKQPWRMAASYLHRAYGADWYKLDIPFVRKIKQQNKDFELFTELLHNNNLFPMTSSAGRLFDAVSALIGTCLNSGFHAEAPMRLEDHIGKVKTDLHYSFTTDNAINFSQCILEIVDDLNNNVETSLIAVKFHNTVVKAIVQAAGEAQTIARTNKVILSGGVFQNKYLLENTIFECNKAGFLVYTGNEIPVNDGGLALGQLIIAAKNRNN